MSSEKRFTPALGYSWLTPIYDLAVAVLTRENVWRRRLVRQIRPAHDDRVVDIGCGTGSLAVLIKQQAPGATVVGVDPDPAVLQRAKSKARAGKVEVVWRAGFLTADLVREIAPVTKVVSSLVLHQTPLEEKQLILDRAFELLEPGGELHIADYGQQHSGMMRFLFRQTVQRLDGIEDTQSNADGVLPDLISKAGFIDIVESDVIPTLTGSISIYKAKRPKT